MNNLSETRKLANRFMEGDTSLEEERRLNLLLQEEQLPADLLPLREMMADLACISSQQAPHRTLWTTRLRHIAAAAAVVVAIGGAALWWNHRHQNECVAYIYGKRCTDREVVLREMEQSLNIIAEGEKSDADQMLNDMFDL